MSTTPETSPSFRTRKLMQEKARAGIAARARDIVEQVTLRKLVHAREFLAERAQLRIGTRDEVRQRLLEFVGDDDAVVSKLKCLLDELDTWGDQRIRLGQMPPEELAEFRDRDAFERKVARAGLEHLTDGDLDVTPPGEMTPMLASYEDGAGGRLLRLVAAKTRLVSIPQKDVPEMRDEEHHPGIVFKPYKEETQKAVAFAEVDLDTGFTVSSTTLLRQGIGYRAEFNEFFDAFAEVIALHRAVPVTLYEAVRKIRNVLTDEEVRIMARRTRTSVGGHINYRAHSTKADLRKDSEIGLAEAALPGAKGVYCNCYWEKCEDLDCVVHTFIFAPEGEVSIMGQVREAGARYVLHRILQIN